MKHLLENDFPQFYGVGRRCLATELMTSDCEFDLIDASNDYVVAKGSGGVSLKNDGSELSVINYESYLNKFDGTKMSDGKRRCDFVVTDVETDNVILLCELTTTDSELISLSKPITKKDRHGDVEKVLFPGGKYQKAEMQLFGTLDNIMNVPNIEKYSNGKKRKVCLMAYSIMPRTDETANTRNAFNRYKETEATEAGENGALVHSDLIESFGFDYYRISHNYVFCI